LQRLVYDVDHSYYYNQDKLTLVFDGTSDVKNVSELILKIKEVFNVNISPFISTQGTVTNAMVDSCADLQAFVGKPYARFYKCAIEGRPDRVKRLGSFVPNALLNYEKRELRGALLAHQFIGNWDTKESNTLLTTVHLGKHEYKTSAVFSDLGTSFGVAQHIFPPDFKVGLVNEFEWEVAEKKRNKIRLKNKINAILQPYKKATYTDLLWMANKIAHIDSVALRSIINKGNWPAPIAELYFHKLASRRASILNAFDIKDVTPIAFNKHLNITQNDIEIIKNGKLMVDFEKNKNPESFLRKKGRLRNYGN
jgi:hypothetical protein